MTNLTDRQKLRLERGKLKTNINRLNKINHAMYLMDSLQAKLDEADRLLKPQ